MNNSGLNFNWESILHWWFFRSFMGKRSMVKTLQENLCGWT